MTSAGTKPGVSSGSPDTIFALSTARGRAGVAIIRISGPAAVACLEHLAPPLPSPRHAALRSVQNPATGDEIDRALVLLFPGPASFTGEDVAELHVHGGPAVVSATLAAIGQVPGCRPAEAGEFTRRAFDNGRLDLTEVEGTADLIAAETEAQRRLALRQMSGDLGSLYDGWRIELVRALAHLEAAIDFPDEDLPEDLMAQVAPALEAVAAGIRAHLDDGGRGERVRAGISVAIVGAPNAGKSSLLNALAGRDVAIVAETAGTTRDVIEVHLDLGGYPVVVADTAGLRAVDTRELDPVEAEGIRRALARTASADLTLVVFDATLAPEPSSIELIDADSVVVINKIDTERGHPGLADLSGDACRLSVRTGAGVQEFTERLTSLVIERFGLGETPALTRERHRRALVECLEALEASRRASLAELAVEDVRMAVRALGRITGRVNVEDLLDVIFRDFCIGK